MCSSDLILPDRARMPRMPRTVITFGTFDVFHVGHLRVLERAAALGDRLVVGVSADAPADVPADVLAEANQALRALTLAAQETRHAFAGALAPHVAACNGEGTPIVLDMSGVDYLSSVGLRALMIAARKVKAQGGRMVVAALTPLVLEVFQIGRAHV